MKFRCINCGAPRDRDNNKFDPCSYCGGLPEVSLSHDRGLLSSAIKAELRFKLEEKNDADLDLNAETSLVVLYLLDNLAVLAEARVSKLLQRYPTKASVLLLSAVVNLRDRGISKTPIRVIDEVVSKLNLILTLDSEEFLSDVAFLHTRIESDFYNRNCVKPSAKFKALGENLAGASNLETSVIAEIFPVRQ